MKLKKNRVIAAVLVAAFLYVSMVSAAAEVQVGGETVGNTEETLNNFKAWWQYEPWKIFGVEKNKVSQNSIRKVYLKLSFKYHPDRNKDPQAEEIFKYINKAFERLEKVDFDVSRLPKKSSTVPTPEQSESTIYVKSTIQVSARGGYIAYLDAGGKLEIYDTKSNRLAITREKVQAISFDADDDGIIYFVTIDGIYRRARISINKDARVGQIQNPVKFFIAIDGNVMFAVENIVPFILGKYTYTKQSDNKVKQKKEPLADMSYLTYMGSILYGDKKLLICARSTRIYILQPPYFTYNGQPILMHQRLIELPVVTIIAIAYYGSHIICAAYLVNDTYAVFIIDIATGKLQQTKIRFPETESIIAVGLTQEGYKVVVTEAGTVHAFGENDEILMNKQGDRAVLAVFNPYDSSVWQIDAGNKVKKRSVGKYTAQAVVQAPLKKLKKTVEQTLKHFEDDQINLASMAAALQANSKATMYKPVKGIAFPDRKTGKSEIEPTSIKTDLDAIKTKVVKNIEQVRAELQAALNIT